MAESVVMILFFGALIFIQFLEQKKILISTRKKKSILAVSIIISGLMLVIFWPESTSEQIKLTLLSILIINFTFLKEGLGKDKIIKAGFMDTTYKLFTRIEIEPVNESSTSITFYKRKQDKTGITMIAEGNFNSIKEFFEQKNLEVILQDK